MKADIFALLGQTKAGTPTADATLSVLSLWKEAIYYILFFTLEPEKFRSHYDEQERYSYLCLGNGCPACRAGIKATEHIYLPVWDAQSRKVAALKFDTREEGPGGDILRFLATYRNRLADTVAVFKCEGKGKFTITAHDPLPDTDRGALACKQFCDGLDSGAISLKSCVKQLTAAEIESLPAVKRLSGPIVGKIVAPAPSPVAQLVGAIVEPPNNEGA